MSDFRRARCLPQRGGCGRHRSEVGPISWGGLCGECGPRIFHEACDGMHFHRGPWFTHWRVAMAASVLPPDVMAALASVGVFALDDAKPNE